MHRLSHNCVVRRSRSQPKRSILFPLILVVTIAYVASVLAWPLRAVEATFSPPTPPQTTPIQLSWPSGTQSALRAPGYGELENEGAQTPIPIASITKIVTALMVLEKKPLARGAEGPLLTFTEADMQRYNDYLAQEGSVGPVTAGATISQYDALQVMLISSANNYADLLAIWSYGSLDAYVQAANVYLKSSGLSNTVVADASGFSIDSKSTASDLAKLGERALANPLIAEIVDKPSVTIDGLGTFYSTNLIVDYDYVIGLKTGTTDEAGNCLLYAARYNIAGRPITIIGATLGAPNRAELARAAHAILEQTRTGFQPLMAAAADQSFGSYQAPWGASANLISASDVTEVLWSNAAHTYTLDASNIKPGESPTASATLTSDEQKITIPLKLSEELSSPSWFWRITHPQKVFAR